MHHWGLRQQGIGLVGTVCPVLLLGIGRPRPSRLWAATDKERERGRDIEIYRERGREREREKKIDREKGERERE